MRYNAKYPPALSKSIAQPDGARLAFGRFLQSRWLAFAGALILANLASPVLAERAPETQLISCGEQSCLEISGFRQTAETVVSINGRPVPVAGGRKWRVHLPLDTVREWSAEHARTIEISMSDPETGMSDSRTARLPIGLLGNITSQASLQINVY